MLDAMPNPMRIVVAFLALFGTQVSAFAQTGTAYIPKAIELPGLTPAEHTANQIWNLRAALNVAALECQFSPYLHTVGRYNTLIQQHSREILRAQQTLGRYFARTGGGRNGQGGFDRYNTRLYQSYSTLDAQFGYCRVAGDIGREVLVQPIGRLGEIAQTNVAALRDSLTPEIEKLEPLAQLPIESAVLPDAQCLDKRGRPKKTC